MRIPPRYEEMISNLIGTAKRYGFYFEYDTLADYPPGLPETGHDFRVCVHLRRTQGDFIEDAPVAVPRVLKR